MKDKSKKSDFLKTQNYKNASSSTFEFALSTVNWFQLATT